MTEDRHAEVLKAEHAIRCILLDLENKHGVKVTSVSVDTRQLADYAVSIHTDLDN